jgi:O-antigen/teichoic acid export membrane protein
MRRQPKTIWNIAANVTLIVVSMISGLLVMPYLILTLGNATYGLWILIGTLTGYFGVLDLGVPAAVGRLIAIHNARDEPEQINVVMSTAFALLLMVSVGVCVATCIALPLFPMVFSVPASSALDVRYSLILVGLSLALAFPASVFSGLLWGFARFDLQNAVDIPALILRTVLTLTMVSTIKPLITLGVIVLAVGALSGIFKMLVCYRLVPDLQISLRHVRRNRAREIFAIGGWLNVISWSRTLIPQIAPTLIGARLGNAAVTTFSVARQLVVYANVFSQHATQVMTPGATGAFATNAVAKQRRLFIEGGKYAYALTIFLFAGLFCLGLPFIHRWQHGLQDAAYRPLIVLMLGESLPMSQWLTYSVLLGAGRQRALALFALSEGVMAVLLIIALIGIRGITGVCIAVAVAGFVARGLAQLLYGCRLAAVPVSSYVRQVFVPVTLAATPAVAALYAAVTALTPHSFGSIFGLGIAYTMLFAGTLAWTLLGYARLKAMFS